MISCEVELEKMLLRIDTWMPICGFFFCFIVINTLFPVDEFSSFVIISGYAVVEGLPVRERRLPCCGIGFGWFL